MFFFNKKLGFYNTYYNELFFSYILPYSNDIMYLYNNKKKVTSSFLLVYPILYKKIFFLELSSHILKKKKMKQVFNLNQTLILEGSLSSHKCIFTVPIFSFLNSLI